eukprot:TRINITY_DN8237_c0_g1_i1.p1 TRINITY_DN8237_c0_g1~~TRINITY_DN8237_c0_g1_i1.p1  ORF type:complete len:230 (-),score=12.34 TRINITY_DN8237_c0_g1_i1:90-779(-)
MASALKSLRIALLNCERLSDFLPSRIYSATGGYYEMLQATFDHVCSQTETPARSLGMKEDQKEPDPDVTGVKLSLSDYDAKGGQFPEDPQKYDGILITGSMSGVYEGDAWIRQLLQEIRRYDELGVRTCGISFGHQAVAHALGGHVARNPKGSEVSVRDVRLSEAAKTYFQTRRDSFKLLYHHNDTIVAMPPRFQSMGGNNVTEFQGMVSVFSLSQSARPVVLWGMERL